MPIQTKFIAPSGGVNVDLSGIFADLDGGTSYGTATKFRIGSLDLTGYFHASTSIDDRPSFNTGYKVNGVDLSAIFRRRGFQGINITSQPQDQLVVNNANATFSVTATLNGGAFTGTYRWRKNGTQLNDIGGEISGATGPTLTVIGSTLSDDGSYDCVLTSGGSSVTSTSATLKIRPYITSTSTVPSPLTADDGAAPVAVQCFANGSGTIFFSWFLNGSPVAGLQNQLVNLTNGHQYVFVLSAATDGNYTCKVTSSLDAVGVTSGNLVATIISPVVTISSLYGQTQFNEGNTVQFFSSLSQGANVSYQWYRNGNIISGATSANYSFAASSSNTGTYKVRATNAGGFGDSNEIGISIIAPIVTISSFNNQTQFNEGNVVQLSSSLSQGTNVTYQWYRNNSIVSGATSSTYNFVISSSNTGTYKVRATNAGGFDDSNEIAISIVVTPPIVTISSSQLIYNNGNFVSLTSSLSQGSNVTYQWYGPFGLISGATSSTYSFFMSASTYGNYYVRATNSGGFDDSNVLTIYMNPLITSNPSSQTVNSGGNAVFTVTAVGSPTLSYQWYRNGAPVGANSNTFVDIGVNSSYNGNTYYCVVSGSVGGTTSATSTTATLTVEFAPTIGSISVNGSTVTSNLQSFSIANGSTITLSASGVNDGQPNATGGWYRWGGTSYNQFLTSNFTYQFTQGDDSTEYYRFILTNSKGTAESYEIEINTV